MMPKASMEVARKELHATKEGIVATLRVMEHMAYQKGYCVRSIGRVRVAANYGSNMVWRVIDDENMEAVAISRKGLEWFILNQQRTPAEGEGSDLRAAVKVFRESRR